MILTDFVMESSSLILCGCLILGIGKFAQLTGSIGLQRKDNNDRQQTFDDSQWDLGNSKDAHEGADGCHHAAFGSRMCKTKLHAGDTVGEQVAQTGCKEDTDRFIDFQLSAKAVDAIAEERTGNRHREGVGAQSGQTAVCQQQRLEEQNNDAGWELEPVTLGIFKADSTKA